MHTYANMDFYAKRRPDVRRQMPRDRLRSRDTEAHSHRARNSHMHRSMNYSTKTYKAHTHIVCIRYIYMYTLYA